MIILYIYIYGVLFKTFRYIKSDLHFNKITLFQINADFVFKLNLLNFLFDQRILKNCIMVSKKKKKNEAA